MPFQYAPRTQRNLVQAVIRLRETDESLSYRRAARKALGTHTCEVDSVHPSNGRVVIWVQLLEDTGLYLYQDAKLSAKWRKLGVKTQSTSLTGEHAEVLRTIVRHRPNCFIFELTFSLSTAVGVLYSESVVYRCLVDHLKFSRQVARVVPRQRDEVERMRYRQALHAAVHRADQTVYLDEAHKSTSEEARRHIWAQRGRGGKVTEYLPPLGVGSDYTFLAAVDVNGFINEMSLVRPSGLGKDDPDPSRGTVTADVFYSWMRYYVAPYLGSYSRGEPRSVVIMDNAPTHFDPRLAALAKESDFLILYLYPYGYDDNPIEHCFNQYKSTLRRHSGDIFSMQLHDVAVGSVSPDNMIRYYRAIDHPGMEGIKTSEEIATENTEMIVAALALDLI